jgi:hypothetical protein
MKILVLGSEPKAAQEAAAILETAGHSPVRCHTNGSTTCVAVTLGTCPLDAPDVAAAVAVRTYDVPGPTLREHGVTCAIQQRIPLVVSGAPLGGAYAEWVSESVRSKEELPDACERAVHGRSPRHERAIKAEFEKARGERSHDMSGVDAAVYRRGCDLLIELAGDVDDETFRYAAIHAARAARAYDRFAPRVEVRVAPEEEL